jgi:hypothetical protein
MTKKFYHNVVGPHLFSDEESDVLHRPGPGVNPIKPFSSLLTSLANNLVCLSLASSCSLV